MNSGSDSTSRAAHSAASRHSASSGSAPRSPHSHAGPSTPTTRTSSNPASRISSASCRRRVKERGREPARRALGVAVRTRSQIAGDDRAEAGIGDDALGEAAEHRRQPGYRRDDHGSTRPQDPGALAEHCDSIDSVEKVIERPEHEHVVERRVGMGKPPSLTALDGSWYCRRGLRAMQRHRIEERHLPPLLRHPRGVPSRSTSDVEHSGWRRQQVLDDQRLRPQPLERPSCKPPPFLTTRVVVEHLLIHRRTVRGRRLARVILFGSLDRAP